jgi:hypothetical protein
LQGRFLARFGAATRRDDRDSGRRIVFCLVFIGSRHPMCCHACLGAAVRGARITQRMAGVGQDRLGQYWYRAPRPRALAHHRPPTAQDIGPNCLILSAGLIGTLACPCQDPSALGHKRILQPIDASVTLGDPGKGRWHAAAAHALQRSSVRLLITPEPRYSLQPFIFGCNNK